MPPPLIIAHRGESREAPENTLAAFQMAWDLGARAVECDVRSTADGRTVVFHDADTRRVCGVPGQVAAMRWAQLSKLDAGRWKGARWAGERIPLLSEVLRTMPAQGRIFVEIKGPAAMVAALARVVRRAPVEAPRVLVMGFDPEAVAAASAALPHCPTALIVEARRWTARGGLQRFCRLATELGAGALDLEVHPSLGQGVVEAIHARGLRVYCWTVNRLATARRLARAGIDGITTDRCAWMRDGLDEPGPRERARSLP